MLRARENWCCYRGGWSHLLHYWPTSLQFASMYKMLLLLSTWLECGFVWFEGLSIVTVTRVCRVQALADAIRRVTDMNPDLSVEKIEIQTSSEAKWFDAATCRMCDCYYSCISYNYIHICEANKLHCRLLTTFQSDTDCLLETSEGVSKSWGSVWLKRGQQPAELHWSSDWSVARLF